MLKIKNVIKSYDKKRIILDNLNVSFEKGLNALKIAIEISNIINHQNED